MDKLDKMVAEMLGAIGALVLVKDMIRLQGIEKTIEDIQGAVKDIKPQSMDTLSRPQMFSAWRDLCDKAKRVSDGNKNNWE